MYFPAVGFMRPEARVGYYIPWAARRTGVLRLHSARRHPIHEITATKVHCTEWLKFPDSKRPYGAP